VGVNEPMNSWGDGANRGFLGAEGQTHLRTNRRKKLQEDLAPRRVHPRVVEARSCIKDSSTGDKSSLEKGQQVA